MSTLIRVTFKARDNGQLFPMYFKDPSQIPEAATFLKAEEVERREATETELMIEQIGALLPKGV
jgi:hypothetical protein